jgi:hypothetical protein
MVMPFIIHSKNYLELINMRKFLLLTAGICTAYAQMKCPKVDCEDKEGILAEKGGCFYAT